MPVIQGLRRDLGDGFSVSRILPAAMRRSVGPFVFLDHMGPAALAPGQGLDVRPHPHINLATITFLYDGAILHRDSLGFVQEILPGEVNWMTAGRGIVHSERTPQRLRTAGHRLHGLQAWVALPQAEAECAPAFEHHAATALPRLTGDHVTATLIAGRLNGQVSPVRTLSPLVYADIVFDGQGSLPIVCDAFELALYVVAGTVRFDGEPCTGPALFAADGPRQQVVLAADGPARAMLLGGAALDGPRRLWWNFVAADPARIERAKRDWAEGRFPPVPGETEFIPLPQG